MNRHGRSVPWSGAQAAASRMRCSSVGGGRRRRELGDRPAGPDRVEQLHRVEGTGYQPRSIHSWRCGRSVPIVVSSPWPGSTIVSAGTARTAGPRSSGSMVAGSRRPNLVLPGPPGKSVSPLNSTGCPRAGSTSSPACGPACGSCAAAAGRPRSPSRPRACRRSCRSISASCGGDADPVAGVAHRRHGLDVVPVAVGLEHPAHAERAGTARAAARARWRRRAAPRRPSRVHRSTKTLLSIGPTTTLWISAPRPARSECSACQPWCEAAQPPCGAVAPQNRMGEARSRRRAALARLRRRRRSRPRRRARRRSGGGRR